MEKPNPNFIIGAIIGVVAAAAAVLLLTPFSGTEIRKRDLNGGRQSKYRKHGKHHAQKQTRGHGHAKIQAHPKRKTATSSAKEA